MDNREVARILEEIADILEITGDNPYKARSYRKAARTISHLSKPISEYLQAGELKNLEGIGPAISAKLEELLTTGELKYHQEMLSKIPPGVLDFLNIPGLGTHTAGLIYRHLGITTLDDLEKALKAHEIRKIPGLGAKNEYNIKKGLEMLRSLGDSYTLGMVLPLARELASHLEAAEGIKHAEPVGSIRRRKPVVNDIDILAAADQEAVLEQVKSFRLLKSIDAVEKGVIRGQVGLGFDFEIIVVEPQDYPLALLLATGPREHRRYLAEALEQKGMAGSASEEELYKGLGMDWIPPELRDRPEAVGLARSHKLPLLLQVWDIKGDLHVHSNWSDGAQGVEELAERARRLGYSYLAITDHSQVLKISRGLDEHRLLEQIKFIRELNHSSSPVKILTGIEVDIMRDGTLDLPDQVLEQLDIVIASIHSGFQLDKQTQTERIMAAIKNPHVDIIGHLTGRLLLRRAGYEVDLEAVLRAAAEHETALEINAHPDRLDISEEAAFLAKENGVKIAINSDAHQVNDLELMEYGVYIARRAGLEARDVLNTLSWEELCHYLENK